MTPGALGQVSVDGPPFNWFATLRFFAKIGLGFAQIVEMRDRSNEYLAKMVLDPEVAKTKWAQCLFSLPKVKNDKFAQGRRYLGDNRLEYVCFEVLPEINKEIYFSVI